MNGGGSFGAPPESVTDMAALPRALTDAGEIAARVLYREARLLDRKAWADWVAMYCEDAVYWVPAWLDEYETTSDPEVQVSLMYHDNRRGLEERIARIRSRKSITALPLPRTVHHLGNLETERVGSGQILCQAVFSVHVYDPRVAQGHVHHGRYEHMLIRDDEVWKIARKVITLVNDRVPTLMDFYSI